uniref:Uncharacterized protein n=1 Tax=Arundo donax TaxID=35708 RepID=A0A0A8ZLM0_ARUDO
MFCSSLSYVAKAKRLKWGKTQGSLTYAFF